MTLRSTVLKDAKTGILFEVLTDAETCTCNCGCQEGKTCTCEMQKQTENTVDAAKEKHIPVISGNDNGVTVKVGSVAHPMDPDHFIEWIEVINGPYVNRKYLKPGEAPEACFHVKMQPGLIVRAYCNKHGLWKA